MKGWHLNTIDARISEMDPSTYNPMDEFQRYYGRHNSEVIDAGNAKGIGYFQMLARFCKANGLLKAIKFDYDVTQRRIYLRSMSR